MSKRGFAIYLTFIVSAVVFMLVISGLDIAKSSVDISLSSALSTQAFYAAEGGIERGLGRLRAEFAPFELKYFYKLNQKRNIEINVLASNTKSAMGLSSKAVIREGGKTLASCILCRNEIKNTPGRLGIGNLTKRLINNENK